MCIRDSYIGNLYQLFTDATEALLPVSPFSLRRTPRLCFVLLSTDSLTDKRSSPWLRQASELMALPVNVVFTPQVAEFLDALPSLRLVRSDPQLLSELLWTLHELTGGWPDLCDRFFEMLAQDVYKRQVCASNDSPSAACMSVDTRMYPTALRTTLSLPVMSHDSIL